MANAPTKFNSPPIPPDRDGGSADGVGAAGQCLGHCCAARNQ